MGGRADGRMADGRADGRAVGRTDGRSGGRTGGRADGWTGGRTGEPSVLLAWRPIFVIFSRHGIMGRCHIYIYIYIYIIYVYTHNMYIIYICIISILYFPMFLHCTQWCLLMCTEAFRQQQVMKHWKTKEACEKS